MKNVILLIGLLSLGACASNGAYHDSIKLQASGINMSGTTGVTAGYIAGTIDRSQTVDKNGAAITVSGCSGKGQDSPDTFTNLNSNASAKATTVAASAAGGVQSPSIAWASGDTTANGNAAVVAAAATTAHAADVVGVLCGNNTIPSAPAGSVVRDGVAPK